MRVLVIGGDAAALVAAHAVRTRRPRARVRIVAPVQDGHIALYPPVNNEFVPAVIPALTELVPTRTITVTGSGSVDDWARKVGRPDHIKEFFPAPTPQSFLGHTARDVFGSLLPLYSPLMSRWQIGTDPLASMIDDIEPHIVINTAPRALFCSNHDHGFHRRFEWLSFRVGPAIDEDTIIVNAEAVPAWFTTSKFDDVQITKWLVKPPFAGLVEDSVPISTNCDCAPYPMVHAGSEARCRPTDTLVDVFSTATEAVLNLEKV